MDGQEQELPCAPHLGGNGAEAGATPTSKQQKGAGQKLQEGAEGVSTSGGGASGRGFPTAAVVGDEFKISLT